MEVGLSSQQIKTNGPNNIALKLSSYYSAVVKIAELKCKVCLIQNERCFIRRYPSYMRSLLNTLIKPHYRNEQGFITSSSGVRHISYVNVCFVMQERFIIELFHFLVQRIVIFLGSCSVNDSLFCLGNLTLPSWDYKGVTWSFFLGPG
jgi:hypothetical protein